jgi:isopentenyldiphosphate isomerase
MRSKRLLHRCTHALVRTSDNYFYVQKRSMLKDYCPGYFDPTPGGVVGAGEEYDLANDRECAEEMGIPEDVPKERLFEFFYEDERLQFFGAAYEVVYDGPVRLQQDEVESVHMMTMEEIVAGAVAGEGFTPDSIAACRMYIDSLPNGLTSLRPTGPRPIPSLLPSIS